MVGENFEIFMSEMPENVANCQKSDFLPRPKSENQNSSPKPLPPGTLKSDFPPRQNPLQNPEFSPKFWGEMTLCFNRTSKFHSFQRLSHCKVRKVSMKSYKQGQIIAICGYFAWFGTTFLFESYFAEMWTRVSIHLGKEFTVRFFGKFCQL